MIRLQVNQLSKSYRSQNLPAVSGVNFQLDQGELLALVGESGSGKTTLLRLLAGLERPDAGEIHLDGAVLSSPAYVVPPEKRGIGLVFQHHALFPHLTVEKNIAFGLRHLPRQGQEETMQPLLDLVGLSAFRKRYPHELSGGERQRVALARALAPNPRLVLLDEPFSSLDARLRQAVRDETQAILRARRATAIFVTHDTGDALSIADQIVVLKNGIVQQTGIPNEVYHSPVNAYVASFFGSCNFLPALPLLCRHEGCARCMIGPPGKPLQERNMEECLWIRPENLRLVRPELSSHALVGKVVKVTFQGSCLEVVLRFDLPGTTPFEAMVCHHEPFPVHPGEEWAVVPKPGRAGSHPITFAR